MGYLGVCLIVLGMFALLELGWLAVSGAKGAGIVPGAAAPDHDRDAPYRGRRLPGEPP
jgi:hypothetical protein